MNYIDFVPYTSPKTRDTVGFALRERRKETMIAVHFGAVERDGKYVKSRDPAECVASFKDFLKRIHTDYTDILMLHWFDSEEEVKAAFDANGFLGSALKLKEQGKARAIALGTHKTTVADMAIESGFVDAIMFPVNPAHDLLPGDYGLDEMWDEKIHRNLIEKRRAGGTARSNLYQRCESEGIGIIAMKPYAGGLLLSDGPLDEYLATRKELRNPAGMVLSPVQCLSYVLERPGICTALAGCCSTRQVDAAVAYYSASGEDLDYSAIDIHELWKLHGRCVYCNHCLPCPEEIQIGELIRVLDSAEYSYTRQAEGRYRALSVHAEVCTSCEVCMKRCPFGVRVTQRMEDAVELFGY